MSFLRMALALTADEAPETQRIPEAPETQRDLSEERQWALLNNVPALLEAVNKLEEALMGYDPAEAETLRTVENTFGELGEAETVRPSSSDDGMDAIKAIEEFDRFLDGLGKAGAA